MGYTLSMDFTGNQEGEPDIVLMLNGGAALCIFVTCGIITQE